MMKYMRKLDWKSDFASFSHGVWKCMFVDFAIRYVGIPNLSKSRQFNENRTRSLVALSEIVFVVLYSLSIVVQKEFALCAICMEVYKCLNIVVHCIQLMVEGCLLLQWLELVATSCLK